MEKKGDIWYTSVQPDSRRDLWFAKMRAVLCSAFTGPEDLRIGEIEEPDPASDEILIELHAASVSFMDHLLGSGLIRCGRRYRLCMARKRLAWSSQLVGKSRDFSQAIAWRAETGLAAMLSG
jgi:hypothetical protein